jgi:hypothetical protein
MTARALQWTFKVGRLYLEYVAIGLSCSLAFFIVYEAIQFFLAHQLMTMLGLEISAGVILFAFFVRWVHSMVKRAVEKIGFQEFIDRAMAVFFVVGVVALISQSFRDVAHAPLFMCLGLLGLAAFFFIIRITLTLSRIQKNLNELLDQKLRRGKIGFEVPPDQEVPRMPEFTLPRFEPGEEQHGSYSQRKEKSGS